MTADCNSPQTIPELLAQFKSHQEGLMAPIDPEAMAFLRRDDVQELLVEAGKGPHAITTLRMQGVDHELLDQLIHFAVTELARAVFRVEAVDAIAELERRLSSEA